MHRSLVPIAVLVCAFACVPTRAHAAIPDAVTRGEWAAVTSPHARVLSDAGLARADRLAERIERLDERIGRTLPTLASESRGRETVFLFHSASTYRDYLPTWQGRPEDDAGIFQPVRGGGFVLLPDANDAELDRVALHEHTHAVLHATIAQPPVWLDEGLAEYFSTLRVDDDDARVGEIPADVQGWLKSHALLPLPELLAMRAEDADYHAGERRQTFYAQSWLLVHLLLTDALSDAARFDRYLADLRSGRAPAVAFENAFGTPERVQYRLEIYLQRSGLRGADWSFSTPYSRMGITREARLSNASVLAAFGEFLRARGGDGLARAREHAEAALALDARDTDALALQQHLGATSVRVGGNDAPPPDAVQSAFDREQRAIGAYNTGAAAFNAGDYVTARTQFTIAAGLAATLPERADLAQKVAHGQALVRQSGPYARFADLHAHLQAGRYFQARRLVRELLAQPLDASSRASLTRMQRALETRD